MTGITMGFVIQLVAGMVSTYVGEKPARGHLYHIYYRLLSWMTGDSCPCGKVWSVSIPGLLFLLVSLLLVSLFLYMLLLSEFLSPRNF